MTRSRRLDIVTGKGSAGTIVVVATFIYAACGSDVRTDPEAAGSVGNGSGGAGGAGASSTVGSAGAGGLILSGGGAVGGAGGEPPCNGYLQQFTVELPPEGVPADAGQICSVMMGPVESNQAARVTLLKDPQSLDLAAGEITVAPALLPDIVGLPTVEVVSSPAPELLQMMVSNMTPTATGFAFDASWQNLVIDPDAFYSTMILRTTFDLACPNGPPRQVQAHTHVNLCDDPSTGGVTWVSSGDECTICGIIAEMAPSPIVPDRAADDLGLGRVVRVRLVVVARIGASLVLMAEHDGGPGFEYEWVPSAGEVRSIAPDVVVWTPPAAGGPHVVQVAVQSDDGAAISSFTNAPVLDAGWVA